MKLRLTAMLVALPALVAGMLVMMSPAEAFTHYTYVSTRYVTMTSVSDTAVAGKVSVSCRGSNRCRGTLYFEGSENRARSYSLPGNSKATLSVTMNKSSQFNPENGAPAGTHQLYRAVPGVKLMVNEASPKNLAPFHYPVQTETRASGRIYYNVNGNFSGLRDVRVELHRTLRGGNSELVTSRLLTSNDSSGFISSALGANNTPGRPYKLKLTALDGNDRVGWWWRGSTGNTSGGSRDLREANTVRSTKDGFDADIYWGTIRGSAPAGSEVRVMAPPASFSGGPVWRRELDVPSCANVFGQDNADSAGGYSVPFLPYDNASRQNYMVTTKVGSAPTWLGADGKIFGSCHSVLAYSYSRSNLIALNTPELGLQNILAQAPRRTTSLKARFSGYRPTASDKYIRIREKVPDLAILDTPVIAQGSAGSDNVKAFNLPYGRYWVEVGRRTSCSAWYPSRYSNNSAYLNGADRGAERWKSFSTLGSLPGNSRSGLERVAIAHGATYGRQGQRPRGYAGWMYRAHCKALGAGTINSMTVGPTSDTTKATSVNYKGAIVKGRVTRAAGRTNKEMLVRLSSSRGTLVLRTDYTDGKGVFYVAGLASGTYRISVNSDSWRGIGRAFRGKQTITVKRGKVYNVGTLRFLR